MIRDGWVRVSQFFYSLVKSVSQHFHLPQIQPIYNLEADICLPHLQAPPVIPHEVFGLNPNAYQTSFMSVGRSNKKWNNKSLAIQNHPVVSVARGPHWKHILPTLVGNTNSTDPLALVGPYCWSTTLSHRTHDLHTVDVRFICIILRYNFIELKLLNQLLYI